MLLLIAQLYLIGLYPAGTVTPLEAPVAVIGRFAYEEIVCDRPPLPSPDVPVILGSTATVTWDDPNRGERVCQSPPVPVILETVPKCRALPCPTYAVFLIGHAGPALPLVTTAPPDPVELPGCAPVVGNRAVSVFITSVQATTGRPGSRSRINYQLGSPNSPIIAVTARIDSVDASRLEGTQLVDTAGMWFVVPPKGTHTLAVRADNAFGCTLERSMSLVVP